MNAHFSGPLDDSRDRFRPVDPTRGDEAALRIVTLWQRKDNDGFRLFARVANPTRLSVRAALRFWNTRHFNYPDGVSLTSPPFVIAAGDTRDVLVGRFPRSLGTDAMALRAQTRLIDCEPVG